MLNKYDSKFVSNPEYLVFRYNLEYDISVYCGELIGKIFSEPLRLNTYDLTKYTSVGLEILYKTRYVVPRKDLIDKFTTLSKIDKYVIPLNNGTASNYSTYLKVPISLVNEVLMEISGRKNEQEKIGGNCYICGDYDKYAPMKNGRFLCYRHFK